MLRNLIPLFSLHLPIHRSRPLSPSHRKIRPQVGHACLKHASWQNGLSSTKISKNSLSAYSLNSIVLALFSTPVQDLLEAFSNLCLLRLHSRSTLAHLSSAGFPSTSSGTSSLPCRLYGVCSKTTPGCSRFYDSTDLKRISAREGTVKAQGCNQAFWVHQLQSPQDWNQIILPKHVSECPLVSTRGFSQVPTPSIHTPRAPSKHACGV